MLLFFILGASAISSEVLAQGYGSARPWGRLPYSPSPQHQAEQPKRYNPWAQMREAERLPPPDYRGEADENAPTYHEPDPTYRELPERDEGLSDPRAYASPWSERYPSNAYGGRYGPHPPGAIMPWGNPYYGPNGGHPYLSPWSWSRPGGGWPW
jgi:hypothetical protein